MHNDHLLSFFRVEGQTKVFRSILLIYELTILSAYCLVSSRVQVGNTCPQIKVDLEYPKSMLRTLTNNENIIVHA